MRHRPVNRRPVLSNVITTLPIGLAGCLNMFSADRTPDGMTAVYHHRVGCILEHGCLSPAGPRPRSQQTVFTTQTPADRRLVDRDDRNGFVDGTEFERAYLVGIVVAAWPSGMWLELKDIDRIDDGLRVVVVVQSPDEPVGDDASVNSLLVRSIDETVGLPDRIVFEVNHQQIETVDGRYHHREPIQCSPVEWNQSTRYCIQELT